MNHNAAISKMSDQVICFDALQVNVNIIGVKGVRLTICFQESAMIT